MSSVFSSKNCWLTCNSSWAPTTQSVLFRWNATCSPPSQVDAPWNKSQEMLNNFLKLYLLILIIDDNWFTRLSILFIVRLKPYIIWLWYNDSCVTDLQIISMLLDWLNCVTTSEPKRYPAPLGDTPHPWVSSGSDQRRSHMGPSWGTSCFRSMVRIWSRVWMLGERPPCTQNICREDKRVVGFWITKSYRCTENLPNVLRAEFIFNGIIKQTTFYREKLLHLQTLRGNEYV